MEGISTSARELDSDPHLLNVENGTVDLRTGELLRHDRKRLITKLAPVRYAENAKCPTWEKFVAWAMVGRPELVAFVQRAFGYCLTGLVREQVWFLLHGSGRNGKTTFLEAAKGVMGDYASRAMPDVFMERVSHPTELAFLAGARFILAVEPEIGKAFRDGLLKAVTGEEEMTARRTHKDPFTFDVTFKIAIAANHLPVVKDDSDGFWRRVRLLPFDNQVAEEAKDPDLREKLRREYPGILAWLVRGAVEWHERGLGSAPEVEFATRTYRGDQDLVRRFVDDECELNAEGWVKGAAIFQVFQDWCHRSGEVGLRRPDFAARLVRVDGVKENRRSYSRGFSGVRLRSSSEGGE